MQADELRAIRTAASLSQGRFAEELGLSRKAVNEMENGKAPIERRTALAALYVAGRPVPDDLIGRVRFQLAADSVDAMKSGDMETAQRLANAASLIGDLVDAISFSDAYAAALAMARNID